MFKSITAIILVITVEEEFKILENALQTKKDKL